MSEDLEDGYRIGHIFEEWVQVVGDAKLVPDGPLGIGSMGSCRNDASLDGFLCSVEVMTKSMPVDGVHSCNKLAYG